MDQINVTVTGAGGTVTSSSPAGVSCTSAHGAYCDYSFISNTAVNLVATPSVGYTFSAVSYTHLDVYKRQAFAREEPNTD